MKHLKTILSVTIVMLAMAMTSIAAAQYHESRLDNFLGSHPHLKADLSRNPSLIYDKQYRREHPELQRFMQDHPNIYGKLRDSGRWGAYGPDNEWHEADWWHEHDRVWMWEHHPEWAEQHSDWREDGDFDEDHHWHPRDWWEDHRADWVRNHHPGWYEHHEHKEAKEAEHREEKAEHREEKVEHHEVIDAAERKRGHHGDH